MCGAAGGGLWAEPGAHCGGHQYGHIRCVAGLWWPVSDVLTRCLYTGIICSARHTCLLASTTCQSRGLRAVRVRAGTVTHMPPELLTTGAPRPSVAVSSQPRAAVPCRTCLREQAAWVRRWLRPSATCQAGAAVLRGMTCHWLSAERHRSSLVCHRERLRRCAQAS